MAEGPDSNSRTGAETREELAALLTRATQLQQRGRLQDAYALYLKIVEARPNHAAANHELGLLLRRAGRQDEAIERLRAATAAEPGNAIYLSNLGVALMDAARPAEAVASYEAALRIDPALAQTRSNLGVALLALGQVEAATVAQRTAVAEAPGISASLRSPISDAPCSKAAPAREAGHAPGRPELASQR